MQNNMSDGLNSSLVGPRPDYRDMDNIPDDIGEKYKEDMRIILAQAKLRVEEGNKFST